VFYERGCEQVCDLVRQVFALRGHTSEVLLTPIDEHGLDWRKGSNHEGFPGFSAEYRAAGADPAECPARPGAFRMAANTASRFPARKGARTGGRAGGSGARRVPVHRVSQGSGIMLMTDDEISEMLEMGRKAAIEVNLFIGRGRRSISARRLITAAGKTLGLGLRGADQLVFAMEDLKRAVRLGLAACWYPISGSCR